MAKSRITKLDFVKQHDIHFYNASGINDIVLTSSNSNTCSDYKKGMLAYFIAEAKNTGPVTISIDTLSVKKTAKFDGTQLVGGDLLPNAPYMWIYDGEKFILLGNNSGLSYSDFEEIKAQIDNVKQRIIDMEARLEKKILIDINTSEAKLTLGEDFNYETVSDYEEGAEYEDGTVVKYEGVYAAVHSNELLLTCIKVYNPEENGDVINSEESTRTKVKKLETFNGNLDDLMAQIAAVNQRITDAEERLENKIFVDISASEMRLVLGEDFDPENVYDYQETEEYEDGTVVKYQGEYAVIYSDEIILTGIKY